MTDVSADGKPDLIVNGPSWGIGRMLGVGDGTFQAATQYAFSPFEPPNAADVNLDGKMDLVAIFTQVGLLIANTSGAYSLQTLFPPPGTGILWGLNTADWNGDGLVDLAYSSIATSTIRVRINGPAGTFSAESQFSTPEPKGTVSGDWNHDGNLDLAVANYGTFPAYLNTVSILMGNGSGAFSTSATNTVQPGPFAIQSADHDQDGNLDLVVVSDVANSLHFLRGSNSGAFTLSDTATFTGIPNGLLTADLDGTSNYRTFVPTRSTSALDNDIRVLSLDASGHWQTNQQIVTEQIVASPRLADIDLDGTRELIVANNSLRDFTVIKRRPNGEFRDRIRLPAQPFARGVSLGDLNEDGFTDLLSVSPDTTSSVAFIAGLGALQFSSVQTLASGTSLAGSALLDLNGDGHLDLAATNASAPSLETRLGDGSGLLGAASTTGLLATCGRVHFSDVNADGALDLLPVQSGSSSILEVLLGNGFGGFVPGAPFSGVGSIRAISTEDFNQDGIADVTILYKVFSSPPVCVYAYPGTGTGSWGAPVANTVGFLNPLDIALGDVTGDGVPDLAFATEEASTGRLNGNGTGSFSGFASVPTAPKPGPMVIVDVNGDSISDIVSTHSAGNDAVLSVVLGGAVAPTSPAWTFVGARNSYGLAACDLDADGRIDIINSDQDKGRLSVFVNAKPFAIGVDSVGSGTPGCLGSMGMYSPTPLVPGGAPVIVQATNVPAQSLGLLLVCDAISAGGYDPFGIGILLHADILQSSSFAVLDMVSDSAGQGRALIQLPTNPSLIGLTACAQSIWVWPNCSSNPYGLSSSTGLILPIVASYP